jgi:hypothetical protein
MFEDDAVAVEDDAETDDSFDLGATDDLDADHGGQTQSPVGGGDPTEELPPEATATCWYEFGNPSCQEARLGTEVLRIGSDAGQYDLGNGVVDVSLSEDATELTFEATAPIDGIIVKAGAGGLVCRYSQPTYGDAGLVAQVDGIPEQLHAVSHVSFCDLIFSQVEEPL